MINFFESLHSVYCCLLFSLSDFGMSKKMLRLQKLHSRRFKPRFVWIREMSYLRTENSCRERIFLLLKLVNQQQLTQLAQKQLQEKNGSKILKLSFKESVIFPVVIADKKCKINAKILKENIPFKEFIKESTNYN